MTNYDLLKQAILNKQQVLATYKNYHREMCPHILGVKNGKYNCLFYQFGGESSSGKITPGSKNNWRCIHVDDLSSVTVQDGEWYTANNHSHPSTCIDSIHVQVSS